MTVRIFFAAVVAATGLLIAGASTAHARSLEIERFDATIDVDADGTVRVEERVRVRFQGRWNGIFRWIPYGYTYPNGLRGMIQLRLDAVEDGAGNALEHWTRRRSGRLEVKIRVPGADDATREVVLRYRAYDVIRLQEGEDEDYGAYDELYWDVTGNDWVAPIHGAAAVISLPASVPPERVRAGGFVGHYGARGEDYAISRTDDGRLRIETDRTLLPGAGLTIAVTFPPGHVAKPGALRRLGWFAMANWHALLPLLGLGLLFALWWVKGRDALGHRTIVPDWRAPEDLRPSELGVLADDTLDRRDLSAALVDLAVRGVLRIEEKGRDWELELLPAGRDRARLEPFETKILKALFDGDETRARLSKLKHAFYRDTTKIRASLLDGLVDKKLFAGRPDKVASRWVGFVLLAVIALVIFGFRADTTWLYWVVLVPGALVMFGLANAMPRRTAKGLDALARVRGLEAYIRTAEQARLERQGPDHFDRILPMAIALGLTDRWAEAFEGLYEREPDWYRTKKGGSTGAWGLARGVEGFDRQVGRTLLAAPRSQGGSSSGRSWGGSTSSGSGFSGGFSGGGFGGGGGGGW